MSEPVIPPGPWRWLRQDTLVADHGLRPVVLCADFSDEDASGETLLSTRGPDGLLVPLTPEHPIAKAIAALPELVEASRAAIAYDKALSSCANDPIKMSSFCSAQGDDLDALYERWTSAARAALEKAGLE